MNDAKIIKNLLDHYQNGRYDEAEKLALLFTQEFPKHQFGWKVLGSIFGQTGRKSESLKANLKAAQLAPKDIEIHNNLGITLQELGRFKEAEESYRQAITLKADFAEAHYNLGTLLKELSRFKEAEASYRQAIALKTNYTEAHNNLGITLQELGRFKEAEESYRQAIVLKADFSDAYLNLCMLLERNNNLDDALIAIKEAKEIFNDDNTDFLFYEALVLFRQEDYEHIEKLIAKINIDKLNEERKLTFLKLKADWDHYKKNFDTAFETYKVINDLVKDTHEYKKQQAEKFFNEQKKISFQVESLQKKSLYKKTVQATWLQPTFIVGFPRSGTTLLDTILRSHSKIDVMEEKPMISEMRKKLGFQNVSEIEKINTTAARIASNFYFEELKKHIEIDKNSNIIDKLPLNILELPLINQIFPQAKFILVLRHPLDCILSCWMQNFKMNPAMANMVNLDRIVDFYCTAMEILSLCQKRYALNIYQIRYEDLVSNFEEEISSILTFLNLKWEDGLKNYQKTAIARGKINTPSYSQVVKPIYNTASYRWKNYEKYLSTYKKKLDPWLNKYKYLS